MKYYKGNINPEPNTIFVFGSNPEGHHGLGAALTARKYFGAIYGVGEGLQGNSYAIPTKDLRIHTNYSYRSISPDCIVNSIRKMYEVARNNPELNFKIAYRNTYQSSLSGYTGIAMIDMFLEASPIPDNIWISEEWYLTGKFSNETFQI